MTGFAGRQGGVLSQNSSASGILPNGGGMDAIILYKNTVLWRDVALALSSFRFIAAGSPAETAWLCERYRNDGCRPATRTRLRRIGQPRRRDADTDSQYGTGAACSHQAPLTGTRPGIRRCSARAAHHLGLWFITASGALARQCSDHRNRQLSAPASGAWAAAGAGRYGNEPAWADCERRRRRNP